MTARFEAGATQRPALSALPSTVPFPGKQGHSVRASQTDQAKARCSMAAKQGPRCPTLPRRGPPARNKELRGQSYTALRQQVTQSRPLPGKKPFLQAERESASRSSLRRDNLYSGPGLPPAQATPSGEKSSGTEQKPCPQGWRPRAGCLPGANHREAPG